MFIKDKTYPKHAKKECTKTIRKWEIGFVCTFFKDSNEPFSSKINVKNSLLLKGSSLTVIKDKKDPKHAKKECTKTIRKWEIAYKIGEKTFKVKKTPTIK
jgi:ubiquitin